MLGLALLAARHVGLVAALQLSSHWEIRSYKVDSRGSIFIDACDIQKEKKKEKKKRKAKRVADHAAGAAHGTDCAELLMTSLQRESDGGTEKAPLSCKFKCGRDVPANLNVRRWME